MTMQVRRSSGNVFRDLGFSDNEAENLRVRSDLMIKLSKLIEERELTQAQAAKLLESVLKMDRIALGDGNTTPTSVPNGSE
jgi:predicted XRE-type DNA-binding protein